MTKETKSLRLSVYGMMIGTEEFDLVWIPHEVILGLLWLEKQNPRIDWRRRQLVFPDKTLVTSEPGVTIKEISLTHWKKYHQHGQACVAWMKPRTQQLCTTQDAVGETQALQLPSEYKEYQEMFEETVITTLCYDPGGTQSLYTHRKQQTGYWTEVPDSVTREPVT